MPALKNQQDISRELSKFRTGEMKTLQEIKEILTKHREQLSKKYSVTEIGVFGSCVRGEQAEESDIDILVEFEKPVSLLDLVGVEIYLGELLNQKVDLIPREDLRPELKDKILKETVYL